MADPRIPEDTIIDIARRADVIEDARRDANDDLKQLWSDAREQFKAQGLTGAEVSEQVALLKGAIAKTRLSDADKQKLGSKAEGVESYLAILNSPRARARARRDKSEPLPAAPLTAAQEAVQEGNRSGSSGRTEPSADGQTIHPGSHVATDHSDAGPDAADDSGSEPGSVASASDDNPAPAVPAVNPRCLKAQKGEDCWMAHKSFCCSDCTSAWALNRQQGKRVPA